MHRFLALIVGGVLVAAGCSGRDDPQDVASPPTPIELDDRGQPVSGLKSVDPPAVDATSADPSDDDLRAGFEGRADINRSGNRVSTGAGDLASSPIDVRLDSAAKWLVPTSPLVGAPWVAVLADERLVWIDPNIGSVEVLDEHWGDAEPVVRGTDRIDSWDLSARFTTALPDGRGVTGSGVLVFLADPTDRYRHGVLGDVIEAAAIEIVSAADGAAGARIDLTDDVVEGRSPLLGDADGDGTDEILVTQSNDRSGARLVLYDTDGSLMAESSSIGRGNRWRSQIAIAPVGPGGEIEIIDVHTPHLGRTVEWFRLDGDELVRVAQRDGFTNHALGSRNLDLAIVADPDGDGRLEVVVPTSDRRSLGVIARTVDGTEVELLVDLGERLSSNVGAVDHPDGGATYAAGTDDGVVRFWIS